MCGLHLTQTLKMEAADSSRNVGAHLLDYTAAQHRKTVIFKMFVHTDINSEHCSRDHVSVPLSVLFRSGINIFFQSKEQYELRISVGLNPVKYSA